MIDPTRIAYWLSLFGERVGRVPSAPVFREYELYLNGEGLTTAEFDQAARTLYATETFTPPPARFVAEARPVQGGAVDVAATLRAVQALGHYLPAAGWVNPSTSLVREKLGEAVADAYALAGIEVFGPEGTTRDIARREFRDVLLRAQRPKRRRRVAVTAPAPLRLGSGEEDS